MTPTKAILEILKTLTFREREIVKLRYGLCDGRPLTLRETADKFKVSIARIRQIQAKAIRKMQHPQRCAALDELLSLCPEAKEDRP